MPRTKQVVGVHGAGSNHWVGDGFPVRNLFPSTGVDANPFLMLDYAGPAVFEPSSKPRGVDEHPHRGFETVTIAYQGSVDHRDSAGNVGTIGEGDVQWMTAASGVVHEEKHGQAFTEAGGTFEMVQLWVNLPKAYKMIGPRYQGITKDQIPVVQLGGGSYARVIAGELSGIQGPAKTFTPLNVFDVHLIDGTKVALPLAEGQRIIIALLRGAVLLNGLTPVQGEAQLAVLSRQDGPTQLGPAIPACALARPWPPPDELQASWH